MDINITEVLERANVMWCDDIKKNRRIVVSRNKTSPLTEEEKQTIKRIWEIQMIPYDIEFR